MPPRTDPKPAHRRSEVFGLFDRLRTGCRSSGGYFVRSRADGGKSTQAETGRRRALYDAIWLACTSRKLIKGEPIEPRRVLVIIGDGHDNASKHSLAQVWNWLSRKQFTIYCISTQAFGFTNESDENLVKLAQETGGRMVYPLDEIYRDTDGYLVASVRRRQLRSDRGHWRLYQRD